MRRLIATATPYADSSMAEDQPLGPLRQLTNLSWGDLGDVTRVLIQLQDHRSSVPIRLAESAYTRIVASADRF